MTDSTGKKYRLGLDLGTNSIGWAAVLLDKRGEPNGVLDMGVRVFPDGRKAERDKPSLAVGRRLARGQRRRRDRYLKRRGDLLELLIDDDDGLMPQDEAERKKLAKRDPYKLRAAALDRPLQPHELGRALFHLDQRRGFKSNRKAGPDESEAKKTRAEIDKLAARIEETGARTLGEFLARRRDRGETVRARTPFGADAETDSDRTGLYPTRAMYKEEFDAIRDAQKPHQDLSDEQWAALRRVIFHQRPLKPVKPGWCQFEFEAGERRAAKALPVTQEFRMLQDVNNLHIRDNGLERRLNEDERKRVLKRLQEGNDINLKNPDKNPKNLGLRGARLNLAQGGRKKIEGDKTAAILKAKGIFGDRWFKLPPAKRNNIARFLLKTADPEKVKHKALSEWDLNEDQANRIANITLPPGYANLSEKAIRKLLPHLERGCTYDAAVIAAGYAHHSDFRNAEAHDELPYYGQVLERDVVGANPKLDQAKDGEPARYGRIGNPTVHIGLNQLRRVVNRLIEVYGKPEEVVVELARELKMNKEQKEHHRQQQWEGEKRNERFAEMLKSAGYANTRKNRLKLRLWEEQGPPQARVCPYTGQVLSCEMVMSDQTEIDHILPFSKTLDDSTENKVVCTVEANRAKGDHSPFEAFGHNPGEYEEILARAATAKFSDRKRRRFDPDAMEWFAGEKGFLGRQLNETSYLSRTARAYLAHLYDETTPDATTGHKQRVRVIPGRMTAILRRGWGLEGMLREGGATGKQRDDHRHHAIDAFVVANTTQGRLQRFMQAAASDHDREKRLKAIAGADAVRPWGADIQELRKSLKPFLDRMTISYKPDHGTPSAEGKTTGELHEATAYGLIKNGDGRIEPLEDGLSTVVKRKKLSDFKRSDIDNPKDPDLGVQDPAMKAALLELWGEAGGDAAKFAELADKGVPRDGGSQPVRRVRVVEKQRVIPISDSKGKPYKGYIPGRNEFADVWRMRDGSWRISVVPKFYANQSDPKLMRFRPHTEAKRLMRLHIDDMGAFGEGVERRIVRVRKITNDETRPVVFLDAHNEANVADRLKEVRKERKALKEANIDASTESVRLDGIKEQKYSAKQLREQGFRKVRVDEVGRVVWDPGPPA